MIARMTLALCIFVGGLATPSVIQAQVYDLDGKTVVQSPPVVRAKRLAAKIDAVIEARLKKSGVSSAPPADPGVWFRRIHLDLVGRIPTLLEVRKFLDQEDPHKKEVWIEEMLKSKEHPRHMSHKWRAAMLPNRLDTQGNPLAFRQFEQFLEDQVKKNVPYDRMAQTILQPGAATNYSGTPAMFLGASNGKPEEMAASVSRVFLGISIDCAQCHSHPFAEWKREQFWQTAAFFTNASPPVIAIPGTKKKVQAVFLDGSRPKGSVGNGRTLIANWVANKNNQWFKETAVDHVWKFFLGTSLLEPIRKKDETLIAHPKLLNLLADEFAAADFDVKHLIRSIVYTNAYRRSSRADKGDDAAIKLFARMPARSLSAEQLFDSFQIALEMRYTPPNPNDEPPADAQNPSPKTAFITKFADQGLSTEKHTSILQALYLMNNRYFAKYVDPKYNKNLALLASSPVSHKRRIESLYLVVLSRMPRKAEWKRHVAYISRGGVTNDRAKALSDVYWALLNSSEFLLNH